MGVPISTCRYTVDNENIRPDGKTLPRHKFQKPIVSDDRALILSAKMCPTQTYAELQATIVPDISISTIQRRLREVGIKKWIAAKRPLLDHLQAATRLKWAREHQVWMMEQCKTIVWSVECSVDRSDGGDALECLEAGTKSGRKS